MTNVSESIKNRNIPDDSEIMETLAKANSIRNEYFRLRVKALIALAKKFGKRRSEIGSLKVSDLEQREGFLDVTFTLRKKHKRGLYQYIKLLRRQNPEALNKPLSELEIEWEAWTTTKEGHTVREDRRTKTVSTQDKYAQIILEYLTYFKSHYPRAVYLFPSGKAIFSNYWVNLENHLSGSQLLRLVKPLNPSLWLHLFRETKGADIAKELGDNILAVTQVKKTLDLEREATAWHYVDRYARQEMKTET